jgi:hypothetical protein
MGGSRSGSESHAGRVQRWRKSLDTPRAQTLEAKFIFVIGKRAGRVHGEEKGARSGGSWARSTTVASMLNVGGNLNES